MLDVTTITIIVTLATLVVERAFDWASRIKKSKCCGSEIDLNSQQ